MAMYIAKIRHQPLRQFKLTFWANALASDFESSMFCILLIQAFSILLLHTNVRASTWYFIFVITSKIRTACPCIIQLLNLLGHWLPELKTPVVAYLFWKHAGE